MGEGVRLSGLGQSVRHIQSFLEIVVYRQYDQIPLLAGAHRDHSLVWIVESHHVVTGVVERVAENRIQVDDVDGVPVTSGERAGHTDAVAGAEEVPFRDQSIQRVVAGVRRRVVQIQRVPYFPDQRAAAGAFRVFQRVYLVFEIMRLVVDVVDIRGNRIELAAFLFGEHL